MITRPKLMRRPIVLLTRNGRVITRSGYGKLNVAIVVDSNYIDNTVTNGIPYFYVVTAVDNNGPRLR